MMKIMLAFAVISFALEVVAVIQYFGGYTTPAPLTIRSSAAPHDVEMPSISLLSVGIDGILCVLCSISALLPALSATFVFFTHAFSAVVLGHRCAASL